ncbi:MAG: uroporphyrinogen-III C-methyltransferase [Chloroflexota bacterium]
MSNQGAIYLVGTGPGDPRLITVKGLALIREADAIVGDLLTHAQLLPEIRPEATQHDVGCRTSYTKIPQKQINQLLVDLAQQGQTVVRLWQGDPFVYGRASLEIAAARQAGIRVILVPGVTSAIAAPAYAGVPVTEWEHATSFAVVTGYESKNPDIRPDWHALAHIETLVILMPLDDLPQIIQRLLDAGKSAETPAIAIHQGTVPQQKQVLATLGTLEAAIKQQEITHPAIVVVGDVAALAPDLSWFQPTEDYPLLGKRILVTRPSHQAAEFMAALRTLGAEPISFPTITIQPSDDSYRLDQAIAHIEIAREKKLAGQTSEGVILQEGYDWLVLTSVNGVTAFWEGLQRVGVDSRCLAFLRIAAIGPATATALQRHSITPDLVPAVYTAEGVLAAFDALGKVDGQRFLLPRADIARKTLVEGLTKRGAIVDEISAYRTVPVLGVHRPPAADIVTFTSPSTVQGYVNCLQGRPPKDALKAVSVVCIGPITAAKAADLGIPVQAVAETYTIEGLTQTLLAICSPS